MSATSDRIAALDSMGPAGSTRPVAQDDRERWFLDRAFADMHEGVRGSAEAAAEWGLPVANPLLIGSTALMRVLPKLSTAAAKRLPPGILELWKDLKSERFAPQVERVLGSGTSEAARDPTKLAFNGTLTPAEAYQRALAQSLTTGRAALRAPAPLDPHLKDLRNLVDDGLIKAEIARPGSNVELDPTQFIGNAYTKFIVNPLEQAPIKLGIGVPPGMTSSRYVVPGGASTRLRSILEHEKGERQVLYGEAEALPFSSHGGPRAKVRELMYASARDPQQAALSVNAALSAAQSYPDEIVFAKLYRQMGGTPSSPIMTGSRREQALFAELLKARDSSKYGRLMNSTRQIDRRERLVDRVNEGLTLRGLARMGGAKLPRVD